MLSLLIVPPINIVLVLFFQAPVVGVGADDNKGELLVGLKYDQEVLTVVVKEANGLPSMDQKSLPNPFVKW